MDVINFIVRPVKSKVPAIQEGPYDPTATYVSFKEHWQQALSIIQRNEQMPRNDDMVSVISNFEQLTSLLSYEIIKTGRMSPTSAPLSCLEYLFEENILRKTYEWSIRTGRYINALRFAQLKLYKMLVEQTRHNLLVHESFLQPLLNILGLYVRDIISDVLEETALIELLRELCVILTQNVELVDLFMISQSANPNQTNFIIFQLLMNYLHRDDCRRARDSLLLCVQLSKEKRNVADYILMSGFCTKLASGLGELYFVLPKTISDITAPDWHRLTNDDINDMRDLSIFHTLLQFSNSVAQVAHPEITKNLQEFMYGGFLIPALAPALVQCGIPEQIAATAYLDLILRTLTQPGLLYPLLQFLLQFDYDGQRLLNILIERIGSEPQLTLVSLALFKSLIDLNCEDIMLELIFQYLQPCLHLMLSQRGTLLPIDTQCQNFERLLALAPSCCDTISTSPRLDGRPIHWNHYGGHHSAYANYYAYLYDARNKINLCQIGCSTWNNPYTGCEVANSLSSMGESSGYESLKKQRNDNPNLPVWQVSDYTANSKVENGKVVVEEPDLASSVTVGPFLTLLMDKLQLFLNNTFYVNLHLTGIISRLAVYSQPLLRTYLLDHSLILQPNVPSLFQIIGSLKEKIDSYMLRLSDRINLIETAKRFLVERESRLLRGNAPVAGAPATTCVVSTPQRPQDQSQLGNRNTPGRSSFNSMPFANFIRKLSLQTDNGMQMTVQQNSDDTAYPKFTTDQHVAICAVLLDEWVKELAALAQEHAISQLTALFK